MKQLLHKLSTRKAVMKMNANSWLSKLPPTVHVVYSVNFQSRGFSVHTLELFDLCYILWQLRK